MRHTPRSLKTENYNASRVLTNTVDAVTTTYGYDDIGQLESESRSGYSASYTYDGNGNRLTRTVNSVTEDYAYDDGDKLQTVKIGGVTQKSYGYDTAGRTTSVVSGSGTTTLAYDYEGRITTITYPSTATNTFTYNGLDTRVSKVDSAGTATYKRDGAGVTAPVLSDGGAVYTPGISERRSSTTTFLHNGLKNADSQTGTGQTVTATKQYDAFGNMLTSTGTWQGPFGYAGSFGYQEDADSSLKLLGHRYYDASTGRFLTQDPIKEGRNWYVYCDSNPVTRLDPDGNDWHDPTMVSVSPKFKGKVWIVGEPGRGKRSTIMPIEPGYISHPGMDVDYVIVEMPGEKPQTYFVPGVPRYSQLPNATYVVDKDGYVREADVGAGNNLIGNPQHMDNMLVPWNWKKIIDDSRKQPMPKNRDPILFPIELPTRR